MRNAFAKALVKAARKNPKIVLICGDIGYKVFDKFRKEFPKRFFNFGIAEQAMVSAASGMALEGLVPYVFTITPFLIERAFEQIKIDIDAQKTNVKLIGYADYPDQGITHAEIDAKRLMSLFKNIKSYYPKSSKETERFVTAETAKKRPSFISLKKAPK
jgi:transketolase